MGDRQPSDAEVIQRCRRGEIELFSLLVERYQDRIYNLAFRLLDHAEDARDVAQETFLRAYSALARFDPDRPFAPWLFRIATNLCYGLLRKRRPDTSIETLEEIEADARTIMDGETVRERMADGEATGAIAAHLERCASCRAEVEFGRRMAAAVAALPRVSAPKGLADHVMAELRSLAPIRQPSPSL